MSEHRYDIDGVAYIQRALVFGQIKQLMALLGSVKIDLGHGAEGLLQVIGDHMPQVLAIVLTPEGVRIKDKNLPELADVLEFAITTEQVVQVIDDFFICNPVVSLLNKLSQSTGIIKDLTVSWVTGLINSYASLQPEISPDGTQSCGDTPPESASTGLNTGGERSNTVSLSSASSEDQSGTQVADQDLINVKTKELENTAGALI